MPIGYTVKRLTRSWQLYIALLLGVILAATFFAGINIGADTAAKQSLDQALANLPVDFMVNTQGSGSLQDIANLVGNISQVQEVTHVEAVSRVSTEATLPSGVKTWLTVVGISDESSIFDGWPSRPSSIGDNATYVLPGYSDAGTGTLKQGDTIQLNVTTSVYDPRFQNVTFKSLAFNLTVAGLPILSEKAAALAQGQYYTNIIGPFSSQIYSYPYYQTILLVNLNTTMSRILNWIYTTGQPYMGNTDILIYVDRSKLINVWDIPTSLQNLNVLQNTIENKIAVTTGNLYPYINSQLTSILMSFQSTLTVMRLSFIVISLPVFFVAWYMGSTVSDVSFNLRRREIGLLSTKGFSRGQLLRMFITEALLIGLIAGAIGIILSYALNPVFVRAIGGQFTGTPVLGIDTSAMTVVFSVAITVLAVFRPARRASNLPTVAALREYMYVEEAKPYKKLWPWVAFLLGTYKMIIFILGINMLNEVSRLMSTGGNFLIAIFLGLWAFFDYFILTYIGPVLFFWGATKIFIRGSLKFQEITARAAKFLGDLGTLASRNVQRNPARAASVAFLIALIIGYGIQVIGTLATDQDYNVRMTYASVGADISITLSSPVNITATQEFINLMQTSVPGIASTTIEYTFTAQSSFDMLQIKAINTTEWPETAYHEDNWFSGNDIKTAFNAMASHNNTIILYLGTAARNNLKVGDIISVDLGSVRFNSSVETTSDFTIVGFFGREQAQSQIFYGQYSGDYTLSSSYVPVGLFYEFSDALLDSSSTRILIKLNSGVDGLETAKQIRALASTNVPRAATVYSAAEALQQQQTNFMATGTLSVQRLGVAFAVLATSVGTGLVTFVSLKERQREASMMGVRGLSYRQLAIVLLTENLAVVAFAVLLGTVAGLIIVYGNAVSFTSTVTSLVTKRMIFPLDASLAVFSFIGLVFASTIIPVLFMTKRYISRLERVVREA